MGYLFWDRLLFLLFIFLVFPLDYFRSCFGLTGEVEDPEGGDRLFSHAAASGRDRIRYVSHFRSLLVVYRFAR